MNCMNLQSCACVVPYTLTPAPQTGAGDIMSLGPRVACNGTDVDISSVLRKQKQTNIKHIETNRGFMVIPVFFLVKERPLLECPYNCSLTNKNIQCRQIVFGYVLRKRLKISKKN